VFTVLCVVSGLHDGLITLSAESYCVCMSNCVCGLETSTKRQPSPKLSFSATGKNLDGVEIEVASTCLCNRPVQTSVYVPHMLK
jgi:hypothetical protein